MEAALEFQQAGKVRFLGISATLPNMKEHIAMGISTKLAKHRSASINMKEHIAMGISTSSRCPIQRSSGNTRPSSQPPPIAALVLSPSAPPICRPTSMSSDRGRYHPPFMSKQNAASPMPV